MPFTIACPTCDARLQAPDTIRGKRVKCKKCGDMFVTRPADEDDDDRPVRRPGKAGTKTRRASDDEDDRPRRSSKEARPADEDDDDRPRRRRRDEDERDEPRPRPRQRGKKKEAAGATVLLLVLLGVGALVVVGGGVGAYFVFVDRDKAGANEPLGGGAGVFGGGGRLTPTMTENFSPGRFSMSFPVAPKQQSQTVQTPGGPVQATTYTGDAPDGVFLLVVADIPGGRIRIPSRQNRRSTLP